MKPICTLLAAIGLASLAFAAPLLATDSDRPLSARPLTPSEHQGTQAAPRPLSPAEERATVLVAELLTGGPAAWWTQLSADSPLRAYGRQAAVQSIALRTGPTSKVVWQMQTPGPSHPPGTALFTVEHPSGMEDWVRLELVEEGGQWKLRSVASLIDHWTKTGDPHYQQDAPAPATVPPAVAAPAAPVASGQAAGRDTAPLALAAVVLLSALALSSVSRHGGGRRLAAAAAVVVALVAVWSCGDRNEAVRAAPVEPDVPTDPLVALLPLHDVLASGIGDPEPLFAEVQPGRTADVARLWKADMLQRQLRLEEAGHLLADSPGGPLADLLIARHAFLRGDEAKALLNYEAVADAIDADGIRLETAEAYMLLGYPYEAAGVLRVAGEQGSRTASVYYLLADVAVLDQLPDKAEDFFHHGWQQRPIERERVLADPMLAMLATRKAVFPLLEVGSAREPEVGFDPDDRHPLAFPPVAELRTSGSHLTVRVRDAKLEVSGGAVIAPITALVEDAGRRAERDEEEILASLERWKKSGVGPALGQTGLRRQVERLGFVLARKGRWADVEQVTTGVAQNVAQSPPSLVTLRAHALISLEREHEALELLIELAKSSQASRRRDPATLRQMADILVGRGEYELALRLLARVESLSSSGAKRVQQVEMEKALAESGRSLEEGGFALRYPETAHEPYVRGLAEVLSAEWQRVRRWVPVQPRTDRPLGVDLFPVQDFLSSYSTNVTVVGLFDGKLRLPFGDLPRVNTRIISILSHELAHAMISQATDDLSPKWFHEGLAQRIEMAERKVNPMPRLAKDEQMLSLSVVESALQGFSEEHFVGVAYEQSEWTVYYIEQRYGIGAIHKLLDAFAAGRSTDEALQAAIGRNTAQLDAELRAWSLGPAPRVVVANDVRHYEKDVGENAALAAIDRPVPRAQTGPRLDDSARAPMAAWHAVYAARTAAIKRTLGAIMPAIQTSALDGATRNACSDLRMAAESLMSDAEAMACPDAAARSYLRAVYGDIYQMAQRCEVGNSIGARTQLDRIQQHLAAAAGELSRYDLKP